MTTINNAQAVQLFVAVGFPSTAAQMMSALSWAESRRTLEAHNHNTNGSDDYGLCQINSIHFGMRLPGGTLSAANVYDPLINAEAAYQIYKDAGASFRPWSTFNSGAYKGAKDTVSSVDHGATTTIDTSHIGGRGSTAPIGKGGNGAWWQRQWKGLTDTLGAGTSPTIDHAIVGGVSGAA